MNINYKNTQIRKVSNTNFLCLTLDSTLSWKPHTDQLISKLNSACFVIRSLKPIIPLETLRMIYFSSVHSIISYSISFGATPVIVIPFLDHKKEWLESWWMLIMGNLVVSCLKEWIFSPFTRSTYSPYYCSLLRIYIYLDVIWRFIPLILDNALTSTFPQFIWLRSRRVCITLE
jgi:hypothetical protein